MSNVIKFPGYIDLGNTHIESLNGGCRGYQHAGKHYSSFKALARDLSERDLERTRKWHVKREGRVGYRSAVLLNDGLRNAGAA